MVVILHPAVNEPFAGRGWVRKLACPVEDADSNAVMPAALVVTLPCGYKREDKSG